VKITRTIIVALSAAVTLMGCASEDRPAAVTPEQAKPVDATVPYAKPGQGLCASIPLYVLEDQLGELQEFTRTIEFEPERGEFGLYHETTYELINIPDFPGALCHSAFVKELPGVESRPKVDINAAAYESAAAAKAAFDARSPGDDESIRLDSTRLPAEQAYWDMSVPTVPMPSGRHFLVVRHGNLILQITVGYRATAAIEQAPLENSLIDFVRGALTKLPRVSA
jgi:hypothetical protein